MLKLVLICDAFGRVCFSRYYDENFSAEKRYHERVAVDAAKRQSAPNATSFCSQVGDLSIVTRRVGELLFVSGSDADEVSTVHV